LPAADDIRFVDVWRRDDAKVAADVIAFWRRLEALPPGIAPEERVKELCTVAYRGGELIGVSTMVLDILPQLKARFGFFRCMVAPDHRRQGLAYRFGVHCRNLLAEWSKRNPQEKVLGMATIVESSALDEFGKAPVWQSPGVNGLALIGYTAKGRQIRVSWFEHARLD
jgi:GNAT superfamily N-acetyltransferase